MQSKRTTKTITLLVTLISLTKNKKEGAFFVQLLRMLSFGIMPEKRDKGRMHILKDIKGAFRLYIALLKSHEIGTEDGIKAKNNLIREKEKEIQELKKSLEDPGLSQNAILKKYDRLLALSANMDYLMYTVAVQIICCHAANSPFNIFNFIRVCSKIFDFRIVPLKENAALPDDEARKYLVKGLNKLKEYMVIDNIAREIRNEKN